MNRQRLDTYEELSPSMRKYLETYGWHFSKKMCEWAVSMMKRKNPTTGKEEPLDMCSKEKTDEILKKYGIKLDNDIAYDATYTYNMARADYMKSSMIDEQHTAMFVKDYLDDVDGYDGIALTRFYADCIGKGIPIMWEDMLEE